MSPLDTRRSAYAVILGVAALVVGYAVAHDQYIAHIAPEHFTVFHDPLWSISDPYLLAAAYGLLASLVPGLLLGLACVAIGRLGALPKVPVRKILLGVVAILIGTEITAATAGLVVWLTGHRFLPEFLYPVPALPLVITQTIQLFCYAASAIYSTILLIWLYRWRRREPVDRP